MKIEYDKAIALKLDQILKEICAINNTLGNISKRRQRPLRVDAAARFLGISKETLYNLTTARKIKHSKPGGKLLYYQVEDLVSWANGKEDKND